MNVMLSIFRTIFFFPPASKLFTFSRSALLSSPSTIRPSSATTDTPSTSRFVIFNATLFSSSLESSCRNSPAQPLRPLSLPVPYLPEQLPASRHVPRPDGYSTSLSKGKVRQGPPRPCSVVSGLFGWLVHGEHPIACRCLRNIPGGTTSPAQFQTPL